MKYLFATLIGFTVIFFTGCDPHDGKLTIVNDSTDTIYYSVGVCNDSIVSYPIFEKNGKIDYLYSNFIEPKNRVHQTVMDTWESFINEACKDSTLRVFFFTENLIKTVGKDSIMKFQLYSKKEKLKVRDLQILNWQVTFP